MKRYGNLINEIIDRSNLEASFDEVTCDISEWSKKYYNSKKEEIINRLATTIGDGSFRITRFEEFEVKDSGKIRKVQSPPVEERIGCNAVMRVVERYVYPTVIPTSCASISTSYLGRCVPTFVTTWKTVAIISKATSVSSTRASVRY